MGNHNTPERGISDPIHRREPYNRGGKLMPEAHKGTGWDGRISKLVKTSTIEFLDEITEKEKRQGKRYIRLQNK